MPPGSMSLGRSAGNAQAPCRILLVIIVLGQIMFAYGMFNDAGLSTWFSGSLSDFSGVSAANPSPREGGEAPWFVSGVGFSVAGRGRDLTSSTHHQTSGAVGTSVLSPIVDGLGTPVRAADPRGPGSVTGSSFPDGCMPDPMASRQADTTDVSEGLPVSRHIGTHGRATDQAAVTTKTLLTPGS